MKSDNNNMTEDELNILADKVLDILIERSASPQWHQYTTPMTIGDLIKGQLPFKETAEEYLVGDMARLTTLMHMYEGNEEYMKAAIIKRKLDIIQNKLNNL